MIAVAVMVMAGFGTAHARVHAGTPVVKAAPCHQTVAKSAADVCKELCAVGAPDQALAAITSVVRSPVLLQPIVYDAPKAVPALSYVLTIAAWWHPPPGEGLPVFLRHQRLLI
jgi:hypothetical protein